MATDAAVIAAAQRVRERFEEATEGGYALSGWYFYIDRADVARMVEYVLGPKVEPEPEPARTVKLTVSDGDGSVVWEGEIPAEDFAIAPHNDGTTTVTFPAPVEGFGGVEGGTLGDDGCYTTGVGQRIVAVHSAKDCRGRHCVIHFPSDHHMRSWPTNWRDGGMFDIKPAHMERICPHGIGHPDPDDAAFHKGAVDVHGCDGCCRPPNAPQA